MMERPLYFAYGSNINLNQMRYRCPDASVYGQAVLDNYDLRFRGSGVATVEPKEGACVYGLLWELTDQCEASLDRYEGIRACTSSRRWKCGRLTGSASRSWLIL